MGKVRWRVDASTLVAAPRAALTAGHGQITFASQAGCKARAAARDNPRTMASTILLAEDQSDIRELIAMNLRGAGYEVTAVGDGLAALASQDERASDLLILDLMMPGMDGLEVCKALRARRRSAPILMLTAKSTELDRVLGLELGADDYLTKPFSLAELLARVKALLRRAELLRQAQQAGATAAAVLRNGELEIQPAKRLVHLRGRAIECTALEFELLLHFAQHPGHVYSRAQLLDAVWGYSHDGYEHTVTTHINRLRAKLEADPMRPQLILTVRGAGYKMRVAS
jgi:DNA-binding response OmpR family regulator